MILKTFFLNYSFDLVLVQCWLPIDGEVSIPSADPWFNVPWVEVFWHFHVHKVPGGCWASPSAVVVQQVWARAQVLHCEELQPRKKFLRTVAPRVTRWEALITGASKSSLLFSFSRFFSFSFLIGSFYWEMTHHLKKLSICLLTKPPYGSAHCAWTIAGSCSRPKCVVLLLPRAPSSATSTSGPGISEPEDQ